MRVTINTIALAAQHLSTGAVVNFNGTSYNGEARIEKLDLDGDSLGQDTGRNRKVAILRLTSDRERRFSINMNDLEAGKLSVDVLDVAAAPVTATPVNSNFFADDGQLKYLSVNSEQVVTVDDAGTWTDDKAQALNTIFQSTVAALR